MAKSETVPTKLYNEIPELAEAREALHAAIAQYKALEDGIADLTKARDTKRKEIEALVWKKNTWPAVTIEEYHVRRHPETTVEKLDRAKLVKAGVTPAQLAAGTSVSVRKSYVEFRPVKNIPEGAGGQ